MTVLGTVLTIFASITVPIVLFICVYWALAVGPELLQWAWRGK